MSHKYLITWVNVNYERRFLKFKNSVENMVLVCSEAEQYDTENEALSVLKSSSELQFLKATVYKYDPSLDDVTNNLQNLSSFGQYN